jgi:hypothetical protein
MGQNDEKRWAWRSAAALTHTVPKSSFEAASWLRRASAVQTEAASPKGVSLAPFRIVADPPVALPGVSVADRRVRATGSPDAQGLRELLCFEPRGHADMYGGFLVPADDDGAHLGVLFWHKDGYSTACGHGTIALGAWAVDTGLVQAPQDGTADVVIDVPSGRVTARIHRDHGRRRRAGYAGGRGGGPRSRRPGHGSGRG